MAKSGFFQFSQLFSHDFSEYSDDTGTQASVVNIVLRLWPGYSGV